MTTPDEFEVVINLTTREGIVDLIAARDEEIRKECADIAIAYVMKKLDLISVELVCRELRAAIMDGREMTRDKLVKDLEAADEMRNATDKAWWAAHESWSAARKARDDAYWAWDAAEKALSRFDRGALIGFFKETGND